MTSLIIFDCDGVLVDSEIIANKAEADVLTELGYAITPEMSLLRFVGMNTTMVKDIVFQETGIILPPDFRDRTTARTVEAFKDHLQPLMHTILSNSSIKKIDKCVASNSPHHRVRLSLDITGLRSYFPDETLFTYENVKKGKPAPDLFLHAAHHMGHSPEECLVIEDSVVGIEAAKAAGMKVIAFLGGSHTQTKFYKNLIMDQKVPVAFDTIDLLTMILKSIH